MYRAAATFNSKRGKRTFIASGGGGGGGGTSALAVLAAGMSAGSWATLTAANQNAVLGVGPTSGSMLYYCGKVPWNPITKRIEFCACDHNYQGSAAYFHARYVAWDDATNIWTLLADDPSGVVTGVQHGYEHNLIDSDGNHYYRAYDYGTGPFRFSRHLYGAGDSWSVISSSFSDYQNNGMSACYWSGTRSGALASGGTKGLALIWNAGNSFGSATDGQIIGYDIGLGTWPINITSAFPFHGASSLHGVICYSPVKNCAVFGGGNGQPTGLRRLNSDGTTTAMPAFPGPSVGIGTNSGGSPAGALNCDPVTGNFIVVTGGQCWELNPSGSGTWTQQTGSRVPPSQLTQPANGVVSASIPDYGVILFAQQSGPTGGTMHVYKHA